MQQNAAWTMFDAVVERWNWRNEPPCSMVGSMNSPTSASCGSSLMLRLLDSSPSRQKPLNCSSRLFAMEGCWLFPQGLNNSHSGEKRPPGSSRLRP